VDFVIYDGLPSRMKCDLAAYERIVLIKFPKDSLGCPWVAVNPDENSLASLVKVTAEGS